MVNVDELDHEFFMKEAIKEAKVAGERGDLPVGAVIVHEGKIISRGNNQINTKENRTLHAEMSAINQEAPFLKKHARECVLYTSLEPCIMCLSTIVMTNIRHVVYAVDDHYMNMKPFIKSNDYINKRVHSYTGGILENESFEVIQHYDTRMAQLVSTGQPV
ncbi:nucleoside deaminase [Aquisalibacillus elongatus]|uniref:tRNA(Adenine34) deaminase n=1 Tax=Aquisalibacillus elongatus TaxID=485577 RepID=A0A3N5BWP3_9BACI|nr:nucleoside deaminase [Aquisalibacillus elongatus]RPF50295.1 tRNA(adenine34) deaminase [Aquisalibacillus elongatus]